ISGERRERPENNLLENSLRLAIGGEFSATELEVYGYPEDNCKYLFFIELSDLQFPYIHVRKPLSGHNITLFDECVPLVLQKIKNHLEKYGKLLTVGEVETGDAFYRHLISFNEERWKSLRSNECGMFYMNPTQREGLMKEKSDAPAGFSFESVDVHRDGDTIHTLWKHGFSAEITKSRLRYLPSICARNEQGEIVGWAMAARFGQVSNLFMMPEHRNRGAGTALEISVAKEFARRGMRVFKYVEVSNPSVYARSLRSPLWTLWTTEDEDNNDTKKRNSIYFRFFERMVLIEWDTAEKQEKLLEILQKDGRGIPNNLVVDTAIRYTIQQRYPVSRMRYFSTEAANDASPKYVFVFEENSKAFSGFYARPPPCGHDEILLQEALAELIGKFKDRLERDGEMLMLSDSFTRHVLHNLLSFAFLSLIDVSPPSTVEVFYMTDEQMRMAKEMELQPIAGFHADSVDLEKDAARIHDNWIHSASVESTRARLFHLPASVVRESSTEEAVSWDMSSPFGQCSNLFTIPSYRGKGLAVLAQLQLVKSFISQGLRPFKYVEITNWKLLEATRRHPLWTRWETKNESMKQIEGPVVYHPMNFTTIRKRE
ncbi:hypothetical protein PENTCL1PPCAC_25750, partial [Pristionchus entomophagus]